MTVPVTITSEVNLARMRQLAIELGSMVENTMIERGELKPEKRAIITRRIRRQEKVESEGQPHD